MWTFVDHCYSSGGTHTIYALVNMRENYKLSWTDSHTTRPFDVATDARGLADIRYLFISKDMEDRGGGEIDTRKSRKNILAQQ